MKAMISIWRGAIEENRGRIGPNAVLLTETCIRGAIDRGEEHLTRRTV